MNVRLFTGATYYNLSANLLRRFSYASFLPDLRPPSTRHIRTGDIRADVSELFARDTVTFNFAHVKIEVDHMIDPSMDLEAQLAQIEQMVATIRTMLPPNATSWDKVEAIRRYIYQAGAGCDARHCPAACLGDIHRRSGRDAQSGSHKRSGISTIAICHPSPMRRFRTACF